jgi:transposase InsO family protein
VPKSCPWRLSAEAERHILDARQRTNYGPARLAGLVGYRRSTIYKVLARHGCSRRRRTPKERSFRRYEWAEPGALLHMDTKRLQRFAVPGHWATDGERTELARNRDLGYVYAHCVVDDHSRLAYVELHATDTGQAAAITLRRAAAWMTAHGAGPTSAVMTDNARVYAAHVFQRELADIGARHIRTPPYTPRWNGKVERFIQTLDHEWAHGRVWPSSTRRDRGLASWLRFYNRQRPHTSLGDRPPTSRVHQDRGQDT